MDSLLSTHRRPSSHHLAPVSLALPLLLGALVVAPAVGGPVHLLVNGDFDGSLVPWQPTGAVAWVGSGGFDTPGRAHCTDLSSCQVSQCVDLSTLTHPQTMNYDVALTHAGNVSVLALSVTEFNNASCSGFGQVIDSPQTFFPPTAWTVAMSSFQTEADTQSVLLTVSVSAGLGSPPLDASVDSAHLTGVAPEEIFADGFESGDTSAWSAVVGLIS